MYNKPYYEACDLLMGISKQTVNINKLVLKGSEKDTIFKYLPHGKNQNIFTPIDDSNPELVEFRKQLFSNQQVDFVLYFNSRNIRRKQIPDTIMAYRLFLDSLPKEKADKCLFILHTELISEHGTDLQAVHNYIFGEDHSHFLTQQQNVIC